MCCLVNCLEYNLRQNNKSLRPNIYTVQTPYVHLFPKPSVCWKKKSCSRCKSTLWKPKHDNGKINQKSWTCKSTINHHFQSVNIHTNQHKSTINHYFYQALPGFSPAISPSITNSPSCNVLRVSAKTPLRKRRSKPRRRRPRASSSVPEKSWFNKSLEVIWLVVGEKPL